MVVGSGTHLEAHVHRDHGACRPRRCRPPGSRQADEEWFVLGGHSLDDDAIQVAFLDEAMEVSQVRGVGAGSICRPVQGDPAALVAIEIDSAHVPHDRTAQVCGAGREPRFGLLRSKRHGEFDVATEDVDELYLGDGVAAVGEQAGPAHHDGEGLGSYLNRLAGGGLGALFGQRSWLVGHQGLEP